MITIINILINISVLSVFISIFIDFIKYENKSNTKKSKKSIVATGSMFAFYFIYYLVLKLNIGSLHTNNIIPILIGTLLICKGAIVNILGRINLKDNWANHIKIYKNHTLINKGMYKLVRHQLYSSIITMLIGGSICYRNYLSFILVVFIFIPFMVYRAKQEEKLLEIEFTEYGDYRKNVGMFFPKFWRWF